MTNGKPRLAVFKFASCDGCQLQLLNLEDELLSVVGEVEIAYFLEATSKTLDGPYDVSLVEGSITTAHDIERIKDVRKQSEYLVTIGACANTGGIQALRNGMDLGDCIRMVYANPAYIQTLEHSKPVASYVTADFALNGCPVSKEQLLELVTSLLIGRAPHIPSYAVCVECKRRGNVCLLVAKDIACMGPITMAGCNALCPSFNRGCFGCYGPMEAANPDALCNSLVARGATKPEVLRMLNGFTGGAEEFHAAAERMEKVGV